MPPLSSLLPGTTGRIVQVEGSDSLSQRLMEMGVLEGESVEVVALAPLGDPMEIRLSNYRLSLRKQEAARVLVAVDSSDAPS